MRPVTRLDRWSLFVARSAAIVFVLGYGASVALYPGGNLFDRTEPGYDLADNYVCDSFRARAYDGRPNELGAAIGQLAMFGLVLATASLLFAAPATYTREHPTLARVGRWLAAVSFAGMLLVPLTPAHEYGHLHFIAIGVAAIPSLVAAFLAGYGVLAVADETDRWGKTVRALCVLTLIACSLHFGQYLAQVAGVLGESRSVPRAQKLVVAIVITWNLVMVAWAQARDGERTSGERLARADDPAASE